MRRRKAFDVRGNRIRYNAKRLEKRLESMNEFRVTLKDQILCGNDYKYDDTKNKIFSVLDPYGEEVWEE